MAIKITQEILDEAYEAASRGLTQEQIAAHLGMSEATLYNKFKSNLEFLETIKRGQAYGIKQIANAMFESAINGNTTAQIFYMKNRAGWADKQELKVDAKVDFENETLKSIQEKLRSGN